MHLCTDNTLEEEIKERIALVNKAYFANKKIFQSKSITKRAKLKLYHSIIRPSSSSISHGVGPLVDPFRSYLSRSLFKGLP
jgi:hypothetical protein